MLETRYVFIDTEYFVKAGLHFDGPAFKLFKKYCESNELIHISTSVVYREVRSKIGESVKEALSAIQKFRRKARILASLENDKIKGLFESVSDENIFNESERVFDEFLKVCSTKIVNATEVDAEKLMELYFEKLPPFGGGKKKAEFPDAVSIFSLKSHLKEGEKIYIVSDDGDMKAFCEGDSQLVSVDSLDKLLDIYTTYTNVRHEKVKQCFIENEGSIKEKIAQYLEECDVYNASTWDDAEVDEGLKVTYLGEIDPSILYVDDSESQVTFDIDVEFEVTVTGPDFNGGIYDREEGRMYTFGRTSRTSTIDKTFTVEGALIYEIVDGELINAEFIGLYIVGTANGIEVSVEENEYEWN